MINAIAISLVFALIICWGMGGPLRALLIAWLVAIIPSAVGIIYFSYQYTGTDRYALFIGGSVIGYLIGYIGYYQLRGYRLVHSMQNIPHSYDTFESFKQIIPIVGIVAFIAIVFMLGDVAVLGVDLSDLTSIRTNVISRESASLLGRLAAITTWACFFCLAYAIYFRNRLNKFQMIILFALGLGTVISSLVSAGRQALFQTILLVIFINHYRQRTSNKQPSSGFFGRSVLVTIAVGILFFISANRSRVDYGLARSDIMLRLFDGEIPPYFQSALSLLPVDIADFFVEGLLYVSHSVPLFSVFADIQFPQLYFGQNSFPFFFRQLEPISGLDSRSVLITKVEYIDSAGLLGVGWNTSLSQIGMDFGLVGTCIFFAFLGAISRFWQIRAEYKPGFIPSLMTSLMIMCSIYTPYLFFFSDTSIIFLSIFVVSVSAFLPSMKKLAK